MMKGEVASWRVSTELAAVAKRLVAYPEVDGGRAFSRSLPGCEPMNTIAPRRARHQSCEISHWSAPVSNSAIAVLIRVQHSGGAMEHLVDAS
jgi:hypothetical protein